MVRILEGFLASGVLVWNGFISFWHSDLPLVLVSHRCLTSGGRLLTLNDSDVPIGVIAVPGFGCLLGELTFAGFVISLMDSVNVLINSDVSESGVSGGLSCCLGLSDVTISGPHVSRSVAMNLCLKSRCDIPIQNAIRLCFFSVAIVLPHCLSRFRLLT